jgi:hypothetical protein
VADSGFPKRREGRGDTHVKYIYILVMPNLEFD